MNINIEEDKSVLEKLIEEDLRPYLKKIDAGDYYAESFIRKVLESGLLSSANKSQQETLNTAFSVVEETAKICMTTAFCLWCHLAALTYIRQTENEALKQKLLPKLENGEIIGGTALSNPMKYYAGLEKLYLSAEPTVGGYLISGVFPAVSNLGENHLFGIIAGVSESKQIMGIVPCNAEGLTLKEKADYLGANGSATYSCTFNKVFVSDEWILSENAASFAEQIRPAFIAYQIPLGLGVTQASISLIEKISQRQNGCNRFLKTQATDLRAAAQELQKQFTRIFNSETINWKEIAEVRLKTAYLSLEAVQASMLHHGSAGYLKDCEPSRKLREAYFYVNLTPTIKHLEKILQ